MRAQSAWPTVWTSPIPEQTHLGARPERGRENAIPKYNGDPFGQGL